MTWEMYWDWFHKSVIVGLGVSIGVWIGYMTYFVVKWYIDNRRIK